MEYCKDYFIHYYQVDRNRDLTIVSLIRILEDIAILQSEEVGYGLDYYEREKVGWMLSRWEIKINQLPKFKEKIKLTTRPQAMNRFYANRYYWLYNEEGDLLVEAASLWIFFNIEKRRPQAVSREIIDAYAGTDRNEYPFTRLDEVEEIPSYDYSKKFEVSTDAIDVNNHVNNSHYFSWALSVVKKEIITNYKISEIRVNYLKETNINDKVMSFYHSKAEGDGISTLHSMKNEMHEVCRMKIHWTKKQ